MYCLLTDFGANDDDDDDKYASDDSDLRPKKKSAWNKPAPTSSSSSAGPRRSNRATAKTTKSYVEDDDDIENSDIDYMETSNDRKGARNDIDDEEDDSPILLHGGHVEKFPSPAPSKRGRSGASKGSGASALKLTAKAKSDSISNLAGSPVAPTPQAGGRKRGILPFVKTTSNKPPGGASFSTENWD